MASIVRRQMDLLEGLRERGLTAAERKRREETRQRGMDYRLYKIGSLSGRKRPILYRVYADGRVVDQAGAEVMPEMKVTPRGRSYALFHLPTRKGRTFEITQRTLMQRTWGA